MPNVLFLVNPRLIVQMWWVKFCSTGITLEDVLLNCLDWFPFLILVGGLLVILTDCIIFLLPFLDVIRLSMSIVSSHDCGILSLLNIFL